MIRVDFEKLGNPAKPGTYMCPGVGEIQIDQEVLDTVARYEGAAWLECDEVELMHTSAKVYTVSGVVPK